MTQDSQSKVAADLLAQPVITQPKLNAADTSTTTTKDFKKDLNPQRKKLLLLSLKKITLITIQNLKLISKRIPLIINYCL